MSPRISVLMTGQIGIRVQYTANANTNTVTVNPGSTELGRAGIFGRNVEVEFDIFWILSIE